MTARTGVTASGQFDKMVSMNTLANKVAIITGASSGIGHAAARLFAREGAQLVVSGRRQNKLDELVRQIEAEGGEAIAVAGDVADENCAELLLQAAIETYGGLDIAFNNAGSLGPMLPTPQLSFEDWQLTLRVNLSSAFFAAKAQVPAMVKRGGGAIVFTSSFIGYTASLPGMAAYAASKAGLIGLTQTLAVEFASRGIRVNALLPGATETPMAEAVTKDQAMRDFVVGLYPMRRMAQPEEIARSALYLASDASSFTTGTALLADGGVSINRT